MLQLILLVVHISAGSVSLATAGVALVTAKGGRWHVLAGRIYAVGMTVVFLTAVPLAILGASTFLFLIALFSFYLVFAGWRFARNRQRRAHSVDWVAVAVDWNHRFGDVGLCGGASLLDGSSQWITLLVFGGIAIALGLADARFPLETAGRRNGGCRGI